jgi:hypothetical protein
MTEADAETLARSEGTTKDAWMAREYERALDELRGALRGCKARGTC